MTIIDRIKDDLKKSMKAKDGNRVSVLRLLLNDINRLVKDSRTEPGEEELLAVIMSAAKRRKESAEAFREGGRQDLADKETSELAVIEEYLPEQMTADQIRDLVRQVIEDVGASSPADMGRVMGQVMPRVKGKADGKMVNEVVRELLAG